MPLVSVDPFFNIWSFADNLYDDFPRHWTGKRNALVGLLKIDGIWSRFMGKVEPEGENYYPEPGTIKQKSVEVLPLVTRYVFENEQIRLRLDFTSPLLLDDLYILSSPFSYIDYQIESLDKKEHEIEIYFDMSAEAAVNTTDQRVIFKQAAIGSHGGISCECETQNILAKSGDDHRIDWGRLYLASPGADLFAINSGGRKRYISGQGRFLDFGKTYKVSELYPSLACAKSGKIGEGAMDGFICLGYDDIKSIEYFGTWLEAYWRKEGETFEEAFAKAIDTHDTIMSKCDIANAGIQQRAKKISEKYCDIVSLAYRQTIAAHKLTFTPEDGEIQFFSKECFSNGCIATVDVTYPSIPLYLAYNPSLVKGMLDPVFVYAAMKQWEYDFAPHDVGQYPLANGQVYGYDSKTREMAHKYQMPIEECGNMILCVAAVCHMEESADYAKKHAELLSKWANYLVKCGWDPENQLCTDDFAGHLARNCNLSIKAILGIAAWGKLLEKIGRATEGAKYTAKARKMAAEWKKHAYEQESYRLAFDREGSWSIKYNLVWDKILNLNIFDRDIAETEVEYYKTKLNRYGLPLDSRSDYTKSDWQMWSAALTDDMQYADSIIGAMWDFLNETPDRVPFSDWYYTSNPKQVGFQNRTVQGGLFIKFLTGTNKK